MSRRWVWTTREGARVAIKDMDDDHLRNLLAFLRARVDRRVATFVPWNSVWRWVDGLEVEMVRFLDLVVDQHPISDWIDALAREVRRRRLDPDARHPRPHPLAFEHNLDG